MNRRFSRVPATYADDLKREADRAAPDRENGSHLALYDDQKVYVDGVIQFVRDVDAGRF